MYNLSYLYPAFVNNDKNLWQTVNHRINRSNKHRLPL